MTAVLHTAVELLCPISSACVLSPPGSALPPSQAPASEHQGEQEQCAATDQTKVTISQSSLDKGATRDVLPTQEDGAQHHFIAACEPRSDTHAALPAVLSRWTEARWAAWAKRVRSHFRHHGAAIGPVCSSDVPAVVAQQQRFLKVFGLGLHTSCLPMHVVEFYLMLAADRLGQRLTIVSLQSSLFLTFADDSSCHLLVAHHPVMSLNKMVDMCNVAENIVQGTVVDLEHGIAAAQAVIDSSPLWSPRWRLLCMILLCVTYTPLFNGGWVEMIIAGISGLIVGRIEQWCVTNRSIARGQDLLAGLFCSIVAVLVQEYIHSINVLAACLSGVVWVLPGLRICLAVIDISSGHSVTGTARLSSGILTAINVGIGISCGLQLQTLLVDDPVVSQASSVFPTWSVHLFVVLASFPSLVLLDAQLSHAPVLTIGLVTAYEVSAALAGRIGVGFGSFAAALVVSCMANLYRRWTPHPSVELYLFSVLIIVPGSVGVQSVLASDTVTAVQLLLQVVEIGIAVVTGYYAGGIILPSLRSM